MIDAGVWPSRERNKAPAWHNPTPCPYPTPEKTYWSPRWMSEKIVLLSERGPNARESTVRNCLGSHEWGAVADRGNQGRATGAVPVDDFDPVEALPNPCSLVAVERVPQTLARRAELPVRARRVGARLVADRREVRHGLTAPHRSRIGGVASAVRVKDRENGPSREGDDLTAGRFGRSHGKVGPLRRGGAPGRAGSAFHRRDRIPRTRDGPGWRSRMCGRRSPGRSSSRLSAPDPRFRTAARRVRNPRRTRRAQGRRCARPGVR